jgi:hypothetical protein
MKVALGSFAQSALSAHAGPDISGAVNAALIYHVEKLTSGRGTVAFPRFASPLGDERPQLEIDVDDQVEAALLGDARRQGVSPPELAGHAVLVYLAELDRVADRPPPADRAS